MEPQARHTLALISGAEIAFLNALARSSVMAAPKTAPASMLVDLQDGQGVVMRRSLSAARIK